jgi:hypothetical protein
MLLILFVLTKSNYFQTIEEMYLHENGRQAHNVLQEDLVGGVDHPKEISITCPKVIIIRTLSQSHVSN